MLYNYLNINICRPGKIHADILASAITNETLEGCNYNPLTQTLDIIFTSELSSEDKTILDAIVTSHISAFPERDFSIELFLHKFAEEFGALSRHQLAKKAPSFITELKFKKFAEIKIIRDHLVTQSEITQAQADTLTSIFAEQNIDLNSY